MQLYSSWVYNYKHISTDHRHLPVTYTFTRSFPRCLLSVLSHKISTATKLRAVDVMELMARTDQTKSKEEELSTSSLAEDAIIWASQHGLVRFGCYWQKPKVSLNRAVQAGQRQCRVDRTLPHTACSRFPMTMGLRV